MSGVRRRGIRLMAATAASVAALLVTAPDAVAQTLRPTATTDGPFPPLRPREAPRPPLRTEPPDDDAAPEPPAPAASIPAGRPSIRGSVDETSAATSDRGSAAFQPTNDETNPVAFAADEADDTSRPALSSATIPADIDPELIQAETEPLLDRRPTRLYRFEPWEPRGIRIGSFIALPEVETGGAWLSNVLRGTPARSDAAVYVRPTLRLRSDWRTHALEATVAGNASSFADLSSENDAAYRVEGRGRLDVTRRTSIELLGSHDVTQESRGRIDSGDGPDGRNDVTTDRVTAALNTRFNRLAVQLRGGLAREDYEDAPGAASDPGRDVKSRDGALRLGWAFKPTLTAFAEAGVNRREHAAANLDGIRRDSDGERYRAGLGFGNRGSILRGEISVGWARQTPDDRSLRPIEGVVVDANLAWRIDAASALLLQARGDIAETTLAGSGGSLARTIGVEYRHAVLRPLIASAGIAYGTRDYEGAAVRESDVTTAVGLEYYLGPEAMIFGRWEHTAYDSTVPGGDWTNDEFRVGVRLRR